MPSADQPTRRKQTGFNKFLLVFDGFQSSHCVKAGVRTIGYLQPNMAGTSTDQIL